MNKLKEAIQNAKQNEALETKIYDSLKDAITKTAKENVTDLMSAVGTLIASTHSDLNDTIGVKGFVDSFSKGYNDMIKAMQQAQSRVKI